MRTSERSLLADLGFSDRDKKDDRHDLAISYLAAPERREELVRAVRQQSDASCRAAGDWLDVVGPADREVVIKRTPSGQLVGFLDLLVPFITFDRARPTRVEGAAKPVVRTDLNAVVVEVKVGRVTTGDVLRQMNFYREHEQQIWNSLTLRPSKSRLRASTALRVEYGVDEQDDPHHRECRLIWAVAAPYDLDYDALRSTGLTFVKLGPSFEQWVRDREVREAPSVL